MTPKSGAAQLQVNAKRAARLKYSRNHIGKPAVRAWEPAPPPTAQGEAMRIEIERRLLQGAVLLGALVPVVAGGWGVLGGLHVAAPAADSQARYLSGLLLGIGLSFWGSIVSIERRGPVFRLLGFLVVVGGLSRLAGVWSTHFSSAVSWPLVMELGVTPMIVLWRERIERRMRSRDTNTDPMVLRER